MKNSRRAAAAVLLAACLSTHPTRAADPAPPALRLGDAASPTGYTVRLQVDPREATFAGEIRIAFRVHRAAPLLWMNAHQLDIDAAEFTQGARTVPVRVIRAKEDFVGFEAEGGFEPGDAVAVIRYRGPIEPVATRGLFRQKEGDDWYAVTQFEAMNARRAMPCFDEPGWKVPWQLTVDAPAADIAISNTPLVRSFDVPDRPGWKRHEFAPTRPLPSYLVAFAVGPFDAAEGARAGISATPMRYFAPRGRAAETRFARQSTAPILALLEDYFGMPYPFEKLDSVPIPAAVGFGAMENPGMITYSSEILLAKPGMDSLAFRRRYQAIAAHEVAHMWFGNLVTLAWWDDIWLNEAFATWIARKTVRAHLAEARGGWRAGEGRRRALGADRLMSARRVGNPVVTKRDVSSSFDAITYNKGSEVLSMFEAWLGPERFRTGVREFVRAHAYGNATSLDFFRALGEASGRGESAVAAFRSFISQPGLPLVDVSLRCDAAGARIEVAQQRFTPAGAKGPAMQWTTPACFAYESGGRARKQCAEITGRHEIRLEEAKSCPRWVLGNAEGAGHWVARYPAQALEGLARNAAKLPEAEAVALAHDTLLLANNGLVARDAALRMADALLAHPAIGVRHGAVEILDMQRDEWLDAAQRARVRDIERRRLLPMAAKLGWKERAGEDIHAQDLRGLLLPFAARMEGGAALRSEARELASAWIADRSRVAASTVPSVLSTAARFADTRTYDALEAAMAAEADRRDRADLLKALAVVREPALRERAYANLLRKVGGRDVFDGRDAYTFLDATLYDPFNRPAGFAFLRAHWDALVAKLPAESTSRLIRPLGGLCTAAERDAFVEFFRERGENRLAYTQALESIDICIASNAKAA